ncbi:MAG: hypothetical protein OIF48_03455 [Silicimonas sp.]|nr:hypothetical protein [Silicimonas sp.]
MKFERLGGVAALLAAGTYMVGFALLVTVLAPLGFGSNDIDAAAVVGFASQRAGLLIVWNTIIYIVNGFALVVLALALAPGLAPGWSEVARALGLIWATLVLGAGMTANVAVERAAHLYASDPEGAVRLWQMLHAVELGLGGGNEIVGGAWILLVSVGAFVAQSLGRVSVALGLVTGAAGVATLVPSLGDTAGALFGLGAIAWFIAVGVALVRR